MKANPLIAYIYSVTDKDQFPPTQPKQYLISATDDDGFPTPNAMQCTPFLYLN